MSADLPDELRALIAAEASAPVTSEAVRAHVRAKLAGTLGHAAPTAATAAAKLLGIKLLAILGIVGVGTAVVLDARDAPRAHVPTVALVGSTASEPPRIDIERDVAPPSMPAIPGARRAPALPRGRSQVELLAEATRALTDGDATRVLALVDEDLRAHRNAPLAEEREALRLSALLALQRTTEARAAAQRFVARYPRTSHHRLVERALAEESSR